MTHLQKHRQVPDQDAMNRHGAVRGGVPVADADRLTHLSLRDPETGRVYRLPRRKTTAINAQVSERWVINVAVPPAQLDELIQAEFLEPEMAETEYGPAYVLALCAIFMKHAGPTWVPLAATPSSHNMALRVACRDKRTGNPAVWVDHRYTDSCLGPAVSWLGFPPVLKSLGVKRVGLHGGTHGLHLKTDDGVVACSLGLGLADKERAFTRIDRFSTCFGAGVRSYGPGAEPGTLTVVDLNKLSDNTFDRMDTWGGELHALGRTFTTGSVYRTVDGLYRWIDRGLVDLAGYPINCRAVEQLGAKGVFNA